MMTTTSDYAYEYASIILQRNRIPMPNADFTPNWADKPRPMKYYPGALSFPLPDGDPGTSVADGLGADAEDQPFTLSTMGGMLRDSYGLIGRRLAVQSNTDVHGYPYYARANWGRGTASGGGLYPCSIYWIAGPGAGVTPGVYHYSPRQHAMQRLLAGDVSGRARASLTAAGAVGDAGDATQFLLVGVKYWANSFKYNSFSYHAVSMDVGTVLQTWRLWNGGKRRIEPHLWFDHSELTGLLGLPQDEEGLFALLPLAWDPQPSSQPAPAEPAAEPAVTVRRQDQEKSKLVINFETVQRIHRSTSAVAGDRPHRGALSEAAARTITGDGIELPAPIPLDMSIGTALRKRRSSFGRFCSTTPMRGEELSALLAALRAAELPTDISAAGDRPLTNFYVFVNHVAHVAAGSYAYSHDGQLLPVQPGDPGLFLQRNYFLPNYNMEQPAVVVVPTIRVRAVLDATGPRGYNLVNATIGSVAQTFYTAAAALNIGCGVALGFDGISYIEELDLADSGESPMLIMMAGHERSLVSDFSYELT